MRKSISILIHLCLLRALAMESLKDRYIFDFFTLRESYLEGELETGLVAHLEKFLLELGQGFAFGKFFQPISPFLQKQQRSGIP